MKAIWKLSSMVATQVNSYYTFVSNYTQPFAMGMANVVAPTGDMAAMGGGTQNGGSIKEHDKIVDGQRKSIPTITNNSDYVIYFKP